MTPEQKQQIEQIRERVKRLERAAKDPHVKTWDAAYYGDVYFLLSLVKSEAPALLMQAQTIRSDASVRQLFDAWWKVNHPFSWWVEERRGEPLPEPDRQLVRDLAEQAFYAAEALTLTAANLMRSACIEKVRPILRDYELEFRRKTNSQTNIVDYVVMALESVSIQEQKK